MLGIIRRSFTNLNSSNFRKLYTSLVRPHLEYASSIWHPHRKLLIKELESVQRRGTKLIPLLKHLSCKERLQHLKLPLLTYRRSRGDLIEAFKIFHHYSSDPSEVLHLHHSSSSTRGHPFKLHNDRNLTSLRSNSFSQRIVNNWNSLPDNIINSPSTNTFKNRLDEYLKNHPCLYDWEATSDISARLTR